jgi:hypothetical protein
VHLAFVVDIMQFVYAVTTFLVFMSLSLYNMDIVIVKGISLAY